MNPYWILRHHSPASIRSLHYAAGWLGVGDDQGCVSLVDLCILRARCKWTAHSDSLLTIHVISHDQVLTHGRDNELKLWRLPRTEASIIGSGGVQGEPELVRTIGVNALNFSRCSYYDGKVAVPNALDAAYIDILDLSTGIRTHEAIGRPDIKPAPGNRLPIVMSLHLSDSVVAGYEDGYIKRFTLDGELVWSSRGHSESVMSTSLSAEKDLIVSVSADDRIARVSLSTGTAQLSLTRTPGKASIALAPDAETFAVGQWNGRIKIYSIEQGMKELGELQYHRDTVECLAFALANVQDAGEASDSQDDQDEDEQVQKQTELVLAAGGRDGKVSLWKYH